MHLLIKLSWLYFLLVYSGAKGESPSIPTAKPKTRCGHIIEDALFIFESLSTPSAYELDLNDQWSLNFNFCNYSSFTCGKNQSYGVIYNKYDKERCFSLTSDADFNTFSYFLIKKNDAAVGISILLTGGVPWSEFEVDPNSKIDSINGTTGNQSIVNRDKRKRFELLYNLTCEKQTKQLKIMNFIVDDNQITLFLAHNAGCPFLQFDDIWQFVHNYRYPFFIIMSVLGILECFFGYRLLSISLFLTGFWSGLILAMTFFSFQLFTRGISEWTIWGALFSSSSLGFLLGIVTIRAPKLGKIFSGFWLGSTLALLLYNTVVYKIESESPTMPLYILISVMAFLGGMIGLYSENNIIIISTSICGAYGTIRALSLMIGYFPNEFEVAKQIKYREFSYISWEYYLYLIAIVLLSFMGIYMQFKHRREESLNDIELFSKLK